MTEWQMAILILIAGLFGCLLGELYRRNNHPNNEKCEYSRPWSPYYDTGN
jgi:hypothetical protein